ncbi:MAG: tRNA glutamyl-Q(34) synthetase GluQRS [Alphaproteobacteria bacterium]|nr:tRNA glutamyl-Q(34) synthetase GluQRS [Alphaproteobacteria bacterium]
MYITRFAPSPTGRLHLGHVYAAKFAYDKAKESGGKFLLRIENIDSTRCKDEYIDGIYQDLEWLGIKWDNDPLIQSEHYGIYKEYFDKLQNLKLVYPCVCTRKEILNEIERIGHAPHKGETVVYPGICKNKKIDLNSYAQYSWRLNIEKALNIINRDLYFEDLYKGKIKANPNLFGDIIIARKDVLQSYHLCSVIDDFRQGVNLVTRGDDLFDVTNIHRLLQELFGFTVPKYCHHELILDENGNKFSKRNLSVTIKQLRDDGFGPSEIIKKIKIK